MNDVINEKRKKKKQKQHNTNKSSYRKLVIEIC